MTNYTKSTNFASKDNLAIGNPLKIVKGTEIDTEFTNIATAVGTKADTISPTFTGVPIAPTASAGTSTTQLATTAFVTAAVTAEDASVTTALALKAPLASPALTGTPTVPTAAVNTNTTQAASTAFVLAQAASATPLISGTAAVGTATKYAREDHVHPINGIGIGQTYQSFTIGTNRLVNSSFVWGSLTTIYTNSTGKPILVSVGRNGQNGYSTTVWVDSVPVVSAAVDQYGGSESMGPVIVPAGSQYAVSVTGGATCNYWVELR